MTRRVAFEGPAWQLVLVGVVAVGCAALVGLGAAWGGYEYGRQASSQDVEASPTSRSYSAEDLRHALDDCTLNDVVIDNSSATILAAKSGGVRGCVVTWFDPPGPVRARMQADSLEVGESKTEKWDNVTVEWLQHGEGPDLTITIEPT
ncbi:hypothetical protein BRM3_09100 [Brachybacterium huguangmaarense]|uniref:Secreted protein n=1 Tax=Brachybacterium huguangmaarense TaxID=1652028 RepID=A0ABY6FXZ6_9MICO|nr:hypothetical protein [Brachybacterium huguangmaarense]UYG15802.1 hypothetical protein BRM3_09100 [Brachybacterium huguangmaarense]